MIRRACIASLLALPAALAVDADNTGESTVTYFGDVRFEAAGGLQ